MITYERLLLEFALLSPNYFTSKYCRGELEGAKAAGVPIVPVFSSDHYTMNGILALNDKSNPETKEAVKAAFGENLIDVNSAQHADAVMANLNEKILGRYFAATSADTVTQKV